MHAAVLLKAPRSWFSKLIGHHHKLPFLAVAVAGSAGPDWPSVRARASRTAPRDAVLVTVAAEQPSSPATSATAGPPNSAAPAGRAAAAAAGECPAELGQIIDFAQCPHRAVIGELDGGARRL
jgi:hypothetical protein